MKTLFKHVTFCRQPMTTGSLLLFFHLSWTKHIDNNSFATHVEPGNIFCQNFNTNENFYSFLLAQQDQIKAIIPKRISYHCSSEKYTQKDLPSFSIDDVEKFDLYPNKNSKYLFYKFNDHIEALGGEKQIIRHTAKVKDCFGLKRLKRGTGNFLLKS